MCMGGGSSDGGVETSVDGLRLRNGLVMYSGIDAAGM